MDAINFYLKDIYQKSKGYRATWLPDKPLNLGQVGKIDNNVFQLFTSLEDKGIKVETNSNSEEGIFDLSSEKGVKITSKIKGKVEPQAVKLVEADAGFIVEFANDNSYVFRLKDFQTTIITNLESIQKQVAELYKNGNGDWDEDYVIISELVNAKSSTILISGSGGVTIEFKVNGNISTSSLDIADSALNLEWVTGQKLAAQIIAKSSSPLYKLVGLSRKWIGKNKLIAKSEEGTAEIPQILEIIEMDSPDS